ncbi:hypothetical protein HO133_005958 [Letharia lupina]|uniref:Uncharacterized protein n=1 Tax=Letharia lupina TaxID=560253 RepID=A0A8H6C819_9LECA|nr:uncharacterized protein HO133_005958 [Letharia lupina]KAF6218607.1 hypothetical protein HO133_005958 [Letharia lupina]
MSHPTPLTSLQEQMTQMMEMIRSMPAQQSTQSATQPATQQVTQPPHQSTQSATQLATQSDTLQEEEQEEELQQANAENTAEKPSGNKATIVKNTAHVSTIPRQVITQQMENTTTIWPAISACLGNITLWYITAMSTQEKDLLRRSQPIGPLQARVTYRTMHIWTN